MEGLAIQPYDLPDADLLSAGGTGERCLVYRPPRVLVVVGKGSDPRLELRTDAILADHVPVLRRATGGCAVVLSPEMLAVAIAVYSREQHKSSQYFRIFNRIIILALADLGVSGLEHAGISDIAIGGRKIAGTALYRNRDLIFYHAILNAASGTELMERYLLHPPRTPDYRAERSHRNFVTSLAEQGYVIEEPAFLSAVQRRFAEHAAELRPAASIVQDGA
jgi:lipoate---protein ligase